MIQHPHSRFSALDEWRRDVAEDDADVDDDERRPPSPAPMDPQCHRPNFRRKEAAPPDSGYWPESPAQFQWRNAPPDAYAYTPRRRNDWNDWNDWKAPTSAPLPSASIYYRKEVEARSSDAMDETLRKTLLEQQRLESQIAFLRRQLIKNVADVNQSVFPFLFSFLFNFFVSESLPGESLPGGSLAKNRWRHMLRWRDTSTD